MGRGSAPVSGALRGIACALAILPALAGPGGALARQATPEAMPEQAAAQEIVFFCGLQNGVGLDRQMTREELDLYFAGGLPTNSWQPTERGCAGDAPYVLFDQNGFFLGFADPATAPEPTNGDIPPQSMPVEDPAEAFPELPATDETASEPAAAPGDQPAEPVTTRESGATGAEPAEAAPSDEPAGSNTSAQQIDASPPPATFAPTGPEPTGEQAAAEPEPLPFQPEPEGLGLAELWASREGKIAVCIMTFESPVFATWMTPAEYELLAARWNEHRPEDESGFGHTLGIVSFHGFGDPQNFGSCETENGVLKRDHRGVLCATVGPNGERIPVHAITHWSRGPFEWNDIPDTTGRCPGDPRWSEIGPRMPHDPANIIGLPDDERAAIDAAWDARTAAQLDLMTSGQIGQFISFDPERGGIGVRFHESEYTTYDASQIPVCLAGWDSIIQPMFLTPEQEARLQAEIDAARPYLPAIWADFEIIGRGDPSNFGSCATRHGAIGGFDASRFAAVCVPARFSSGANAFTVLALRDLGAADGGSGAYLDPDPATGQCAQGMEFPDHSGPASLPPDMPVFGGL